MEQKAPRIAVFASVLSGLSAVLLLVNAFAGKYPGHSGERVLIAPLFDHFIAGGTDSYWDQTGWNLQETVWAIATFLLVLVSFWGRQLRPVPELPKQPTVAEQLESFENIATPVSNQYSKPYSNEYHERTSSIISSVLGDSQRDVDQQSVSSAITSLSSGSLGAYASAVVAERNSTVSESVMETEQLERTNIDSETLLLSPQNSLPEESLKDEKRIDDGRNFVSDGPAYIPLPGVNAASNDLPIRKKQTEFVSDGPASIPLPVLPDFDDEPIEIPLLPDLESLFSEPKNEVPTLPNLDDLF
jgi:hypothetical protein